MRGTRRAEKREWAFTSALIEYDDDEVDALQGLIMGRGHYWSFDADLYSSKGLGPVSGHDGTQSDSGGKYGGKLTVNGEISYQAGLTGDWTVLVYRWDGAVWDYYAVRSDGAKWLDGSRNDGLTTTWLSVSAGVLKLTGTNQDYDELIALPYLATVDMIEAWMGLAVQFSPLPKLNVSGDFVRNKTIVCMGEVRSAPYVAPAWQRVEFALREV